MFTRLGRVGTSIRVFARAMRRTGLAADVTLPGLAATARAVISGSAGPSAIFSIQGRAHPDRVAVQFEGRRFTFRELDRRIDALASALHQRGLGAGASAVVMLENRPECLEIPAALSRLGASSVAVSPHSTPTELARVVNHSAARGLFFEAALWPVVDCARRDMPRLAAGALFPAGGDVPGCPSLDDVRAQAHGRLPPANPREGAMIVYTSGTTGAPKGAVRRFARGQLEGWAAFMSEAAIRVPDRHLCVCPLYHSTGMLFASMCLMLGGTMVLHRSFDAAAMLAAIERDDIRTTAVVPTMLHRLIAAAGDRRRAGGSLRAIFCGGAPLSPAVAVRALERFGPVLYNFYGATETALVTLATPDDLRASPGTVGRALPGCSIRLLDEAGRDVPDGEVGELFVRNRTLVDGYFGDADATRGSMRDGFFSVGDLATRDAEGRLHIVGRKRDLVISGGVNIYPREIEHVLEQHPGVAEAAVVGVPDEEWGERLRAFVVRRPRDLSTADDLGAFCRRTLAGAKVPREWVFLDALPVNPTGKILKRELQAYAGPVERLQR